MWRFSRRCLIIGLVAASSWISAEDKSKPEQYQSYALAKRVRLVITQSYGEAKGILLPIDQEVVRILRYTGLTIVRSHASPTDCELTIEVQGEAIGSEYNSFGTGSGETRFTGASIDGRIVLSRSGAAAWEKSFSGYSEPLQEIQAFTYLTPSAAPFAKAWQESTLISTLLEMIVDVFGTKVLPAPLQDPDHRVRESAADLSGNRHAIEAVPVLITLLKDPVADVRQNAAGALGEIKAPTAVLPLIAALKDSDSSVRESVVKALAMLKDPRAVEPICACLNDTDSSVAGGAVQALGDIGDPRAIPHLVKAMEKENGFDRSDIVSALGKISDPQVIPPLIEACSGSSYSARQAAIKALSRFNDPRVIPSLLAAITDKDSSIRRIAIESLDSITARTHPGEPTVGAFITALQDSDGNVRNYASSALGKIGDERALPSLLTAASDTQPGVISEVEAAVRSFLEQVKPGQSADIWLTALTNPNSTVRALAAKALAKIGDLRALAPLLNAIHDPQRRVKENALDAFTTLSVQLKAGDPAVQEIAALLKDPDSAVRLAAAKSLETIKDPLAIPELLEMIKDSEYQYWSAAAETLQAVVEHVPAGSKEADLIIAALRDANANVRHSAVMAMARIRDPRAISGLLAALDIDDQNRRDVNEALKAVVGRVKAGDPAVNALVSALVDPSLLIQKTAIDLLGLIKDPRTIKPLASKLQSNSYRIQSSAIRALGQFSDPAIVPYLAALLRSKQTDPTIQEEAAAALGETKSPEAIDPLIEALKGKLAAINSAVAMALQKITGQDFGPDQKRWREWRKKNPPAGTKR